MDDINWSDYGYQLNGFRPGLPSKSAREADVERTLANTHRRWASELRAMLAGKPSEWTPNMPGMTPAQAKALAEQVVAGQSGATPGEIAVARAFLANEKK